MEDRSAFHQVRPQGAHSQKLSDTTDPISAVPMEVPLARCRGSV